MFDQTPGNEWDSLPIFKRDIAFRITVFLPAKNHYLNPILESDLPNFNQTMEQFTYDFESVTLRGTNGWVRASEDVRYVFFQWLCHAHCN